MGPPPLEPWPSFDSASLTMEGTEGTAGTLLGPIGIGMDMIGEAVPPLLAKVIAHHIAEQLDAKHIRPLERTVVAH